MTQKKTRHSESSDTERLPILTLGVPDDEGSSFLTGPAQAPPLIRRALYSPANNLWAENGVDLQAPGLLKDAGDLDFTGIMDRRSHISLQTTELIKCGNPLIALGGDHAITYPLVRAFAERYENLTLLHLDAHTDLYDELHGNPHSHGCPMARIMEEKLVNRLVQVGIRTLTQHHREQIERFGVEVHEMRNWRNQPLWVQGPVYLSVDLDVLEPALAPGIGHYEPGGMTPRQVIDLIHGIEGQLVGADVVEFNPLRDLGGITAAVAARFVREIAGKMVEQIAR